MKLAWKEIKQNKSRFVILSSIVFLVSLLTFIISGLAEGLSYDNASFIQNMPKGTYYMTDEANETYNFSKIDEKMKNKIVDQHKDASPFSIQMGSIYYNDQPLNVAFVTSENDKHFPKIKKGEILLDESLKNENVKQNDKLTSSQLSEKLTVKGFIKEQKFSHSPVAFIHPDHFKEMYHTEEMQMIFIPNEHNLEIDHLQAFSSKDLLNTIPSFKAEQLSLNMIVWFLIVISGMLFGIFFYMMNVQKTNLYGILKAIGVKTINLFQMMWTQMIVITTISLSLSILCVELFSLIAPEAMPFQVTLPMYIQFTVIFFIIGFLGSTISGIQIKNIEPLQAIQRGGNM